MDPSCDLVSRGESLDLIPSKKMVQSCSIQRHNHQWIGLRENLQETMVFTIKYGVFL